MHDGTGSSQIEGKKREWSMHVKSGAVIVMLYLLTHVSSALLCQVFDTPADLNNNIDSYKKIEWLPKRTQILVTFACFNLLTFTKCFRIVCFYNSSAQYRKGLGFLQPEDIQSNLCTHVVYSYAKVKDIQVENTEQKDDDTQWKRGIYYRFLQLRSNSSNVKLLLALGNVDMGPESLFQAAESETMRQTFSYNVTKFIRSQRFDGLHLEWSSFATNVHPTYDKTKFLNLAKSIRAAFDEGSAGVHAHLILTVSLPAIKKQIDKGYLIRDLIKVVDFITIRTVDMRTDADKKVGLSSPLFSYNKASGDDRYLSLDWVVKYYQSLGVPAAKINIGIATYGRTFTLANPEKSNIGDNASGPGLVGPWTETPGILGYYEVCEMIRRGGKVNNEASQHGRYYVYGNQWISFDDVYSVMQKVCYMKKNGIGGATFWTIDLDDFTGQRCLLGKYPLITTAVNTMLNADMSLCAPTDRHIFVDVPTLPYSSTTPVFTDNKVPNGTRVVCYFINWAQYRQGKGRFLPEHINPHICTHIVYAYSWIRNNAIIPYSQDDESENWHEGMFHRVVKLKRYNPRLKVLLAVGGYSAGPAGFENVSRNSENRKAFTAQAVRFLDDRQFDGLEVDWQHVTADFKMNNILLIEALRLAFNDYARISGKPRLLLSVALPAGKKRIDEGYGNELTRLIKFTDFVSLLTYDFHGSWDVTTGFNAPLYASPDESGEARYLNVDWVVRYYVSLGVPEKLINIGIATYGRSFTLSQTNHHYVGAMVMRIGEPGIYTGKPGLLSYYEICDFIATGAQVVRDTVQNAVYVFKDYQWVGYDDVDSVTRKVCYSLDGGYGGVLIWSLDYDDFTQDSCQEGVFPLTRTAFKIMQNIDMKVCSRCVVGWMIHAMY